MSAFAFHIGGGGELGRWASGGLGRQRIMTVTVKVPKSDLYTLPPGHLILQLAGAGSAFHLPPSCPPQPQDTVGASFYLYLPTSHPVAQRGKGIEIQPTRYPQQPYPLLVLAHGSGRDAESIKRRWKEWAEQRGVVLLAPLFPIAERVSVVCMRGSCETGPGRGRQLQAHALRYGQRPSEVRPSPAGRHTIRRGQVGIRPDGQVWDGGILRRRPGEYE